MRLAGGLPTIRGFSRCGAWEGPHPKAPMLEHGHERQEVVSWMIRFVAPR
jgi:hypothetical protein